MRQRRPDNRVTIDPASRPERREGMKRRGRPWMGLAVLAAVALAFGWMLRSSPTLSELTEPSVRTPTTSRVLSSTTESSFPVAALVGPDGSPSDVPLGELVPGFVETITVLTWSNDELEVLRWPASGPAPETVWSGVHHDGGRNRGVDASGRWLAEIREANLYVEAIGHVGPVGITGFGTPAWSAVWHDSRPGQLAWLSCIDEEGVGSVGSLFTSDVSDPAVKSASYSLPGFGCEDPNVWLTQWGDWGTLLHTTSGSGTVQVLLSPDGEEVFRSRVDPTGAWFVGRGPEGTTVWTEGLARTGSSSFLLSPDGLERRPVPGLDDGERLESVSLSPDGSTLVLVPDLDDGCGSEVRITATETGGAMAEIEEPSRWVTRTVWSTDGRFLIYERWPDIAANWAGVPQDVELVFYDTQTENGVAVPIPGYAPTVRSGT